MSKVKGQMVTCDRCDTQIFLKHVGDGERDGGFTRWNKFEPIPMNWGSHEGKDLCPNCYKQWVKLETEFMSKERDFFKEDNEQ